MFFASMVTNLWSAFPEDLFSCLLYTKIKKAISVIILMNVFLILNTAYSCRLAYHCLLLEGLEEYIDMASIVSSMLHIYWCYLLQTVHKRNRLCSCLHPCFWISKVKESWLHMAIFLISSLLMFLLIQANSYGFCVTWVYGSPNGLYWSTDKQHSRQRTLM